MSAGRSHRRAATLLSVTAGTAAILVTMAMLVTSMTELRRSSKELRCLHNLGQIGAASMSFALQNSAETPIPVHPLTGQSGLRIPYPENFVWGGKSGRGETVTGQTFVNSLYGTRFGRGPATRALNSIIYRNGFPNYAQNAGPEASNWRNDTELDMSLFQCPGDFGFTGSHSTRWRDSGLSSYDHYGNSYAANIMWVFSSGFCFLRSNSPFLRPLTSIPNPSRTYLYIENAGLLAWRQNYDDNTQCSSGGGGVPTTTLDSEIRGWHGRSFVFNLTFSDGHAARRHINGIVLPSPDIGTYPPDINGNTDLYYFYRCVISRGHDWQKDTLPSRPIQTGIPCFSSNESQTEDNHGHLIPAR